MDEGRVLLGNINIICWKLQFGSTRFNFVMSVQLLVLCDYWLTDSRSTPWVCQKMAWKIKSAQTRIQLQGQNSGLAIQDGDEDPNLILCKYIQLYLEYIV